MKRLQDLAVGHLSGLLFATWTQIFHQITFLGKSKKSDDVRVASDSAQDSQVIQIDCPCLRARLLAHRLQGDSPFAVADSRKGASADLLDDLELKRLYIVSHTTGTTSQTALIFNRHLCTSLRLFLNHAFRKMCNNTSCFIRIY